MAFSSSARVPWGSFQAFQRLFIPLKQLDSIPALVLLGDESCRQFLQFCPRYPPPGLREDVLRGGLAALEGHFNRRLRSLHGAFVLDRRGLNHLASQQVGKLFGVDDIAVFLTISIILRAMTTGMPISVSWGSQVQVPLNVGAIHQVEDDIRVLPNQVVPG